MVLQKIIFQIVLDNKDIVFVLFVLNIIYMVLRRYQMYHNLGLSIISNFSLIRARGTRENMRTRGALMLSISSFFLSFFLTILVLYPLRLVL